ncbi:MAG: hypothetical protein JXJ17_10835 [Anaerolineae bacterium]|nr:hypothetical protein [Anaerolineae bacterium]
MPESLRMWIEITFNIAYLIAIYALVILMIARRDRVAPEDRTAAALITWAFALLALGDTGYVGFRVIAYALGDLEAAVGPTTWVGLGALATAFTVTLFYVLMLFTWKARFDKPLGWFGWLLIAAAVVRLVVMAFPANEWYRIEPPWPMSLYRNIPLMVQGLGAAYLILRDANKNADRLFTWVGVCILISYACYLPVIFFVRHVTIIGMLMIPKTLAYVAIAVIAYRGMYEGKRTIFL